MRNLFLINQFYYFNQFLSASEANMGMLISLYRYVCIKTWLAANKLSLNMEKNEYSRKHTEPGPCCLKDE